MAQRQPCSAKSLSVCHVQATPRTPPWKHCYLRVAVGGLTLHAPTAAPLAATQDASLISSSWVRLPCFRILVVASHRTKDVDAIPDVNRDV